MISVGMKNFSYFINHLFKALKTLRIYSSEQTLLLEL
jgi:hypothetical protein